MNIHSDKKRNKSFCSITTIFFSYQLLYQINIYNLPSQTSLGKKPLMS